LDFIAISSSLRARMPGRSLPGRNQQRYSRKKNKAASLTCPWSPAPTAQDRRARAPYGNGYDRASCRSEER